MCLEFTNLVTYGCVNHTRESCREKKCLEENTHNSDTAKLNKVSTMRVMYQQMNSSERHGM